ncbi:carbonic anhydrase [Candidatus Marinarcus aquaticus]|uniref:Carbonic anhydrase n=1 Tax=Candidatus Marinarcus aquaticus TaxID=2044504 RepID=A0A4Q0XSG6_9BACT|nr:carbonic anhydrase [Candidatus Marinarcus aquaticus]RXJ56423.1 carbonic anhydrase [Candidatus Marinarcus aquaticus]
MTRIQHLIKGNEKFRSLYFPYFEKDLKKSVKIGQKPEVLFIGCSDSRVTPDLMLDTKPGDMFILRNVGNFIPPFKADNDFHGSAAGIEYAVSVLKVRDIIVCGHSHCGACKSLYEEIPNEPSMIHIKKWLELGQKAKEFTLKNIKDPNDMEELYRQTERNSILYQVENLFSYPAVKQRIESGDLRIHGWYYSIETGTLEYYDREEKIYKPLKEIK